ncbi:hypothetical protein ACFVJK_49230 [Streptomyces sp. NPDC127172]|uniref:hypothetical protein n=1 Tax=Streptomyces sp. NPDC127172 TaxID=3345382 RepID=UPI00364221E4
MLHTLASSAVAALLARLAWGRLHRDEVAMEGEVRISSALLLALLTGTVMAWPSMAVWHLAGGSAGSGMQCTSAGVPVWWPTWLPV